jgi:hypothetical protein
VPGVVLSGYNTWMNSYGEVDGVSIEPEPWQLQYICCGLPIDNTVEHYDAIGRSCKGGCRAERGKLVITTSLSPSRASYYTLKCRPTCEGESPLPYASPVICVCVCVCVCAVCVL